MSTTTPVTDSPPDPATGAGGSLISSAGIITAANYPDGDPADRVRGLGATLDLIVAAEELGYDTAGVRQRQLERGSSSALTVLAAASQRTTGIGLETSVVPLGYEVPFRLAEDFATVDALSGGRVTVGISTSAPHHELLDHLNRPDHSPATDPLELLDRFLEALRGAPLADALLPTPYGELHPPAVLPSIPDALSRVWLGAGSARSVDRAASLGLGVFLGNIGYLGTGGTGGTGSTGSTGTAEGDRPLLDSDFTDAQRATVDRYLAGYRSPGPGDPGPRVAVERVIVPLDPTSPGRSSRYRHFAQSRRDRTLVRHRRGDRTVIYQRDLVGSPEEIVDRLSSDPVFDGTTGLRLALPYALELDDYLQIITDVRERVLPSLGWTPRSRTSSPSEAGTDPGTAAGEREDAHV
ncbi:hypothetical protein Csp1_23690 [Corynebacterium provencense]|uniref:Luciferase-like domain-containing protein n=1 Tax=Corynebacterium provencense TaxID=1737425 RepID=A0A2Z3YS32_9CORY|nr:LLM class flavin-dependent oxidoreductase [Corynebacterium provencense]AWT27119.1 hypothetical protein Csp1_23690 [Corynebacterium provencense]